MNGHWDYPLTWAPRVSSPSSASAWFIRRPRHWHGSTAKEQQVCRARSIEERR
jgi:hypothetical protein